MMAAERELKGWHVAAMFVAAFTIIIGVNLALAFNAVATFPGLETKNSYVASQSFEADRAAQDALGWTVSLSLNGDQLELRITDSNGPVAPEILQADLGRATHVGQDQVPAFVYTGGRYVAPVKLDSGNWNLRLKVKAADGTEFRRRLVLRIAS